MEIKPIRSDADHHEALLEIQRLWGAEAGTPAGDRLDVLLTLVAAWETERFPMPAIDPIDAIRIYLEDQGLTTAALVGVIGSRGRVSEVMNRKRSLSLQMIRALHKTFGMPYEALMEPTIPERAAG